MGCCASGALVHERIVVHAKQRAEAGGVFADKTVKELEDGGQSEAGADEPQGRVDTTRDQYIDPASLVQILRTKQVRLLRAEFILEWIDGGRGPLPCRQDLPEEGFVDVDAFDVQQLASFTIISISYCWASADHPDPECYHLNTIGSLLRCFLKSSFSSARDRVQVTATTCASKASLQEDGAHFGAGDGRCVGIFLDWTGLYQDKPTGRRTSEETEVFKHALKTINTWYAHITTIVWMLTSLPAGVQRKGYQDSGWTAFEASVASILTKGTDMLEISDAARHQLLTCDSSRLDYIQLSHDFMARQSRVPALPDEFNRMIDGKVFTNGADKDTVVKPKYAKTFYDLIPASPAMKYAGLGLTPENVYKVLDLASAHIKNLVTLDLSCNKSINLPIQSFAQLPSLTTLYLGHTAVNGEVGTLDALANLQHLDLSSTQVGGDLGGLQPLVRLEVLHLNKTQVTGDVGSLRALVNLTMLNLNRTQVTGDVGTLHSLVHLTALGLSKTQVTGDVGTLQSLVEFWLLDLGETQVCGDVGELRVLGHLEELRLTGTQATGNVGALQSLVHLTSLDLDWTQVTGDVGLLRALVNLTQLRLRGTQVAGDVGALQNLVHLTLLDLEKTQVCGDVGALRVLGRLTLLRLTGTQATGDVGALQSLVKLKNLWLDTTQITGDVGKLQVLGNLNRLNLADTKVSGDVGALEALVNLKHLNLKDTQVGGDVGGLQPLVHLTELDLGNTQVAGDVSKLHVLGNVTDLYLRMTQVGGDVGKLRALVHLKRLDLDETQVTGDLGTLEALVSLTHLWLRSTRVTGKVSKLNTFVKLESIDLHGTQVTRDVRKLQDLVHLKYVDLGETPVTSPSCQAALQAARGDRSDDLHCGGAAPKVWTWPGWSLNFRDPCIEVFVIDEDSGEKRWVIAEPQSRVVNKDGHDAYICAEYKWDGELYTQDFGPEHVRRRGEKHTVMDEIQDPFDKVEELEKEPCAASG